MYGKTILHYDKRSGGKGIAVCTSMGQHMCMRRVSGQRWPASNALDAEQRIFDAVMTMRHRRLPVSMKQLRALAIKFSVRQTFKASAKFALSFMRRWRL